MAQNSGKYRDLYAAAERKENADKEGAGKDEADEGSSASIKGHSVTVDATVDE